MESASSELEVGKEVTTSEGESSSAILKSPGEKKPVVVRVKRKVSQSPLDAFWLEINEKPAKRALLNFEKLSISGSSANGSSIVEELKNKRVLVQHVQTVQSSEATVDLVQSVVSKADAIEDKTPAAERRHAFKKDNRQNQLSKSRQKQEEVAKSARFEQIWRSRKGRKEEVDEMYNFYEVARVDNVEERSIDVKEQEDMSLEEHRIMNSFLPLLREFIPSAAEEIESDMQGHMSSQVHADEYVYDYYTVNDDMDVEKENAAWSFPLVQVDDEEFYDVPYESEHDSEDSNAEDNPRNDYPDEISEDEDELESESSSESEEEEDSESKSSSKSEGYSHHGSESSSDDPFYDSEFEGDEADAGNFSDCNEDGEDWRWSYR